MTNSEQQGGRRPGRPPALEDAVTIHISLSREQRRRLEEVATRRGMSMSEVIRELVDTLEV